MKVTINNVLRIVVLLIGIPFTMFGQQTPVFANYNYNAVVINPAYAGFNSDADIVITNRGHLNAIEGSPQNIGLTVNLPTKLEHIGLGGGVFRDQVGVTSTTNLFGAYAYKLFFNSDVNTWWSYNPHVLSFGITGGVMLYDENLLGLGIQNDPNFANNINTIIPTLGIGALYNRERIYIGLSAPNLLGNSLSSENNINLKNPYYVYGGYRVFTTRFQEIMINPSILLKYVSGAPLQADFNTKINYKNKFEFGTGYRTNASVNFFAGFYILDHFRVVYNYNKTLRNTLLNDTHGLVLNFRFGEGFL